MIVRGPRPKCNYTVVSKDMTENVTLSWAARGLLTFLLGKPDNWNISREHLAEQSPSGEAHVRTLLTELEDAGYLIRTKNIGNGKITWNSVVYDTPHEKTLVDSSGGFSTGGQTTGESTTGGKPYHIISNDITNTDLTNTDKTNPSLSPQNTPSDLRSSERQTLFTPDQTETAHERGLESSVSAFDTFWAAYPRKVAPATARKAYSRILKSVSHTVIMKTLDTQLKVWKAEQRQKKYMPYPTTWLNQEPWNGELEIEKQPVVALKGNAQFGKNYLGKEYSSEKELIDILTNGKAKVYGKIPD